MATRASKRRWATVMVLGAAVAVGGWSPRADAQGPAHFKLAYSAGFLTDPLQVILVHRIRADAARAGLTMLASSNANGDAGKQITDIHDLIAAGAQALLVNPTDSQAIIPALNYAAKKKVPVVMVDAAAHGGKVAMIVRADNIAMANEACRRIGTALKGHGAVLSLMGDQATTDGRDRTTGFDACMKANFPHVRVIERPTFWKADTATSITQTIVTSTPDLAAIYMQSDSVMLAGVLHVLRGAGKLHKVGEPGHIYLLSIDGTAFALDQIRKDLLDVVIAQPLGLYAKYGVQYIREAIAGKTFKPGPTDHDSHIVTFGQNLMDLLPAPVVTKANVNTPTLWGNAKGG